MSSEIAEANEPLSDSQVTGVPVEEPPATVQQEYVGEGRFRGHTAPAYLYMEPVVLSLVFFSMLGVLVRVHVTRLLTYDKQPTYALLWVQMIGCFIMGVCMRTKGVLLRFSPALNTGLTTGLCGSITTFSSWQLLVYQQFFNTEHGQHIRFKNFLGGLGVLVSTMACAMGALRLGQMAGEETRLLVNRYLRATRDEDPDPLYRINTKLLGGSYASGHRGWFGWDRWRTTDLVLVGAGLASLVAAVLVVALARSTRSVSIALLFGPVGTLIRWRLASFNAPHPWLKQHMPTALIGSPLGTLAANVLGSMVLAIVHILQTGVVVLPSAAACYVLAAMADGFCGCLTTVSTFAAEVSALSRRRSVAYTTASVVATQIFFLLIDGVYFKSATVDYTVC
ncbi:hypothetical protein IW140_002975 [Coemansia sp. RSA 1813]|nr:hypothetical protein EV178_003821 [Coemansia sp. RSA 1646]KAJ1770597.1 hypothetical protein LPJ74_003046 [Coemansia sp. RSA 1843]KAJ2569567.1 hypothetical protein IW140_002975 [Coemansia sp. RSA 1813]